MKTLSLLALALLQAPLAFGSAAEEFHARFAEELRASPANLTAEAESSLHFTGGRAAAKMLQASSLGDAIGAAKAMNLTELSQVAGEDKPVSLKAIKARELTIVILPGVFAEFIKNRAFEEVLEKESAFREEFSAAVKAAKDRGEAAAEDSVDFVRAHGSKETSELTSLPMDKLLSVGEMSVSGNRVRVVLLGTPFASMESLGRSDQRVDVFTRRLEKYLALTGPQDLAFVGYSRGTILGLDMLAAAKKKKSPWLARTRGLVALGGVVMGSSLADDATSNEQAPMFRLLGAIESTMNGLELIPEGASLRESGAIFARNSARWLELVKVARAETKSLNEGKDMLAEARSVIQVDPRSPLFILLSIWKELGLINFFTGYNANIERARYAFGELAASIRELSTEARTEWWKKTTLPQNVTYYAITGAMANPEANETEKSLFANVNAYGNGSYDDVMLLQNRKDYEKISGLSANDSQVAVPQAVFLPKLIAKLNRANRGLKTEFLGVVGTHHWGLALREVNKMNGGQQNGFPREALLRAIAGQVMGEAK